MKQLIILCVFTVITAFALQSCKHISRQGEKSSSRPVLLSNIQNDASCVFLTADENNMPIVSWVEIDRVGKKHFFFSGMDTVRNRFSKPVPIPIEQNASIHEEGMPKIAVKGNGTLIATYETSTPHKNMKWGLGDVRYIRSYDNGKTWTTPTSISPDVKKGLSANFTDLIRLGNGEIGVSWLGTNPGDSIMARPVYFAKTNGKEGFGKEVLITRHACQCCRTALSSDEKGDVSIAFRDILPGSVRDISVSTSTDFGNTFSRAVTFSNDDWVVNGCPHNGPSVVTRNNHTYVTWYTGGNKGGVYYAELDSSRKLLLKKYINPNGRFIQLCLMPDGTRITVYNETYQIGDSIYSRIVVNKINQNGFFEKTVTPANVQASYPVVKYAKDKDVVVAWTDREKVYYQLVHTQTIKNPVPESIQKNLGIEKRLPIAQLYTPKDPVCGMILSASNIGDTTMYHKKLIGFCSSHCKEVFLLYPKQIKLRLKKN